MQFLRRAQRIIFSTFFIVIIFTVQPGMAAELANGQSLVGAIAAPGVSERYTFFASAGESVVLNYSTQGTSNKNETTIRVYDPDGLKRVTSCCDFRAEKTGIYTVIVSATNNLQISYVLSYAKVPGANEKGPMVNGGAKEAILDFGDLDSYTFFANAGESVVLNYSTQGTSNKNETTIRVYDPDGLKRVTSCCDFRAEKTGIYTVIVSATNNLQVPYVLSYAKVPGATEKGPLVNGGAKEAILDFGDLDSYTFFANAGESVVLNYSTQGTSNKNETTIRVYDPDGLKRVTSCCDFRAEKTGIYTVIVSATNNLQVPYVLSYENLNKGGLSYAALGDSYSSGEGVIPYRDMNEGPLSGCHRSTRAYPTKVILPDSNLPISSRADTQFDFFACSGAVTDNVRADGEAQNGEPPQLATSNAINANRDLVTISIGGNDAQFARVFLFCISHSDCNGLKPFEGFSDITLGDLAPLLIANAGLKVVDLHKQLRSAAPNATVLVLGYPTLLSGNECPAAQFPPVGKSDLKLSASEQAFLRDMNALLNTVIKESAAIAGLHFVSVADRFAGHEICGNLDDWVNGVVLFNPTFNPKASVHPTARGQQEYANAVNDYLALQVTSTKYGLLSSGLPRNPSPVPATRGGLVLMKAAVQTVLPEIADLQVSLQLTPSGCDKLENVIVPGQGARLRGNGFAAYDTLTFSLVISGQRVVLGSAAADASGVLDAIVTIPSDLSVGSIVGVEALGAGPTAVGRLLLNLAKVEASSTVDADGDSVPDICDNCSAVPNSDQRDTDNDGYGNMCDADLDNNGVVNTVDLALFKASFGQTGDGKAADFDGNYVVNTLDLALFKSMFGKPPGPANTAQH